MAQPTFKSIIFIAIGLIVACFAVGYFGTTSQWKTYSLAKDQLVELQAENESLNQALAAVKSFLESYNARQSEVGIVNLALPLKSSDLANFASSLGGLAQSSGVVLSNISIQAPPVSNTPSQDNSIQVAPINLSASGSFASFKDFMIRLQDHLRIVDVGHITLTAAENGLILYQISLKTYFQK